MRGLLNREGPIAEITFTFDNCTGQNKNRMVVWFVVIMVIRFMAWLVESGFFLQARLGSWTNQEHVCNCLFNLLKKIYREKNIYVSEHLMAVLNDAYRTS